MQMEPIKPLVSRIKTNYFHVISITYAFHRAAELRFKQKKLFSAFLLLFISYLRC